MTAAEEIRRAAALMRDPEREEPWVLAVAAWLAAVAEAVANEGAEHTVSPYEAQHALAVARAYLGEPRRV